MRGTDLHGRSRLAEIMGMGRTPSQKPFGDTIIGKTDISA
jgi:hypothetical protein